MFFTDGKSRIDFVLVWCRHCPEDDENEINRMNIRRSFEKNLQDEGLALEHDFKVLIV